MQNPTVTEVEPPATALPAPEVRHVGWRLRGRTDIGRLTSATMIEAGGTYSAAGGAALRVGPLLALWMRTAPDDGEWLAGSSEAIGGMATALELTGPGGGHRAFAIGVVRSFRPPAGAAAPLRGGGERDGGGAGAGNVAGDPGGAQ